MKFIKVIRAEEVAKCSWCEDEFPISDLMKEKDFGYLCDKCRRALKSRGEKLVKAEKDNWYERRWDIARRDISKEVANNYTDITGVDINTLFTKSDYETGAYIENVNAKLFDKQLPKIYRWVKQKYKFGKDGYDTMINDSDFVDLIVENLVYLADIDKVKYEGE